MINSIKLTNFKSIKEKKFDLKNLNLSLGLNGMGKSSFVQSFLLLRQSNNDQLKLNGNLVNIGTSKDALYQYIKKDENLSINIEVDTIGNWKRKFVYKIEADYMDDIVHLPFDEGYIDNSTIIKKLKEEALFTHGNFQYLNAGRAEPKSIYSKSYSNVINDKNLGKQGEFTAHFIETHGNEEVIFDNLIHKDSIVKDETTGKDITVKTLTNQINLWMGEISPGVNVRTTSISSEFVMLEYVYKQPNYGSTNKFKPENVGFGITYALPVVTTLLSSRPGQLIIIENPESHIHPRGQAELGKLIARVAMNDVQIIVETHSDHIVNGIRVAVKEEDITPNKVAIFYFDKIITGSEQYTEVTDIKIDKNGTLNEYPENLLDEWSNQLSKLI